MSETLYRKYRPQKFSEIVGQEHIVTTLTNAISSDRLAHGYLFTGPRGTGKTTIARLFAQAINCEKRSGFTPVDKAICEDFITGKAIDLIEIDAASHTGVDNIRELRDTVAQAPTSAQYKVYIIDEVHMLSTGAFNALLKTLEEPPAHAVFILATTEIHKVPETIISRVQRYDFTRLSVLDIASKIKKIAKAEKVKIDDEAVEMIAIMAEGGMRDAESLLSQVFAFSEKAVTAQDVSRVLGTTTNKKIYDLIESFVQKDVMSAIEQINEIAHEGYSLSAFTTTLIVKMRALLLYTLPHTDTSVGYLALTPDERETIGKLAEGVSVEHVIKMISECESARPQIAQSTIPQLALEIAAVNICGHNNTSQQAESGKPQKTKETSKDSAAKKSDSPEQDSVQKKISVDPAIEPIMKSWPQVIADIREKNISLASMLSKANPLKIDGEKLIVAVKYDLHKEKIEEQKNQLTIQDSLAKIISMSVSVTGEVVSEDTFHALSPSEALSRAADMMGGQIIQS